jgi:GNAT superfamily N-acetyltransferase
MNYSLEDFEIKLLVNCPFHIPRLVELWYQELGQPWNANPNLEVHHKRFLAHCNDNQLPLAYIATYQDQAIGMACLRVTDNIFPELTPWLGGLVVDPQYRNNNIGETLVNVIKDHAVTLGYSQLYLLTFNETLPNWYNKLGWQKIGVSTLNGHPVTVMQIFCDLLES